MYRENLENIGKHGITLLRINTQFIIYKLYPFLYSSHSSEKYLQALQILFYLIYIARERIKIELLRTPYKTICVLLYFFFNLEIVYNQFSLRIISCWSGHHFYETLHLVFLVFSSAEAIDII